MTTRASSRESNVSRLSGQTLLRFFQKSDHHATVYRLVIIRYVQPFIHGDRWLKTNIELLGIHTIHTIYVMWNIECLRKLQDRYQLRVHRFYEWGFIACNECLILIESDTKIMTDKKDRHFQQTWGGLTRNQWRLSSAIFSNKASAFNSFSLISTYVTI